MRQFWQLSRLAQIALVSSLPIVLIAISATLIGPRSAFIELVKGFWQLPSGAVQPFSRGTYFVAEWQAIVLREEYILVLGLLLAKSAALELLPVGTASSLRVLWSSAGWVRQRWTAEIQALALPFGLPLLIVWGVVVAYVFFFRW